MSAQSIQPLLVVIGARIALLLVMGTPLWLLDRKAAADKIAAETYWVDGAICPNRELWLKWEKPERNLWRASQEKLRRQSSEEDGNGCYRKR